MNKIQKLVVLPAISLVWQSRDYLKNSNNQIPTPWNLNFSQNSPSKSLIERCLPIALCEEKNSEIPSFINLRDLSNLNKKHIPLDHQTPPHVKALSLIINDMYEVSPRLVSNTQGVAFCTHPEVLVHAMEMAKGEIAVEIGAADGLNAIMLAFGGAKKVYVNDITPTEIQKFEVRKKGLPLDLQAKLQSVEGDGTYLLKKYPELEGKVGLILCRNVIHLQDNEKQIKLLNEVKKLLKPGGIAMFSTNAPSFPIEQKIDDDVSRYVISQLLLYEKGSPMPIQHILEGTEAPSEMKTGFYEKTTVCMDTVLGLACDVALIQKSLKFTSKDKTSEALDIIQKFHDKKNPEKVLVLNSLTRAYTEKTLANLFTMNGFVLDKTIPIQPDGHLVTCESQNTMQVVAIVKKG